MIAHSILVAVGPTEEAADLDMARCCDLWEALHPEAYPLDTELAFTTRESGILAVLGITFWEPDYC